MKRALLAATAIAVVIPFSAEAAAETADSAAQPATTETATGPRPRGEQAGAR